MDKNPFQIIGDEQGPKPTGQAVSETDNSLPINDRIKNLISSSKVFLFMKGMPQFPQCGFSANVIAMLDHLGAEYKTFDILSDMDIRQGVKEFSNWPTYPQLYVDGELIGGNDIIHELFESSELKELLGLN